MDENTPVDYFHKSINVRDGIITGLILIIIALSLYANGLRERVSDLPQTPSSVKLDTTHKPLPPAQELAAIDSTPHITVRMPKLIVIADTIVDSALVLRLLAERDSLARLVAPANVSVTFSTDTIHPVTHDTLKIDCDEINRRISYSLSYAPREETIITRTETYIKPLAWYEKLLYALGGFGLNEIIHFFRK